MAEHEHEVAETPAAVDIASAPRGAMPFALSASMPLSPSAIMRLQRAAGNRAVGRILARQHLKPGAPVKRGEEQREWEGFRLNFYLTPPTIDDVRKILIREDPGMIGLLEVATLVEAEDGVEEFHHPTEGVIARFRRARYATYRFEGEKPIPVWRYGVDFLDVKKGPAVKLPDEPADPTAGVPRTMVDPLVGSYYRHFDDDARESDAQRKDRLDTLDKVRLALELADTTFLGEIGASFKHAIRDPMFITVTALSIVIYVGLWLTPEPTMITKVAAGILTAVMLLMFSWEDIWGFCVAWNQLSDDCRGATTEEQLTAAGDKFMEKLGQVGFDVLLMLVFHGVEKGVGPKVRAGARARATARAETLVGEARNAPGSGAKVTATPERATTMRDARRAAGGDTASPGEVLDALDKTLDGRPREGLAKFRQRGDAQALQALEGQARNKGDVLRFLEEQGMSPEEKAAAKQRLSEAEAEAARKRLAELRGDKALDPYKRGEAVRWLRALIERIAGSNQRLREAIKNRSTADVISIITEVLARAELEKAATAVPGMEIHPDIEVARRVPGYTTIAEWHRAALEAWTNAGSPLEAEPRLGRMRQRGNEVWESLGQADNLVTARKGGKLTIIEIEETKSGTKDTHADASAQARSFLDHVGDINDGRSDARLFERSGPQELGADRTSDFDLSSARGASVTTRGLPGKAGFSSNLPYDRSTLEALAKDLVDNGLPAEPSGGPFKGPTEREPDKVPIGPLR